MRALFCSVTALALAACNTAGSDLVEQTPERVVAAFGDVISACSAQTSDNGVIDQKAVAAAGWLLKSRKSRHEITDTTHALDSYPTLRAGEYEATDWVHAGHAETMQLIRQDELTPDRLHDHCYMNGRVSSEADLAAVVSGISRLMGKAPDRTGAVPRGGDFLTPRNDPQQTGYYWSLPRHDVYLQTSPGLFANIDVVAMPNRAALDQYSSDRPENRIVILTGAKPK